MTENTTLEITKMAREMDMELSTRNLILNSLNWAIDINLAMYDEKS